VTLPAGLHLSLGRARRGVSVTTTARRPTRLPFTATAAPGRTITIALRSPIGGVRVALKPPALRQVGGKVANAARTGHRLALAIGVIDAEAGNSRLGAKVAARR
jgi:hypothetical protein